MSATLKLDPNKTALVLIDLQNGIVGRDTRPYTAGEVIERSRTLAESISCERSTGRLRACSDERLALPAVGRGHESAEGHPRLRRATSPNPQACRAAIC